MRCKKRKWFFIFWTWKIRQTVVLQFLIDLHDVLKESAINLYISIHFSEHIFYPERLESAMQHKWIREYRWQQILSLKSVVCAVLSNSTATCLENFGRIEATIWSQSYMLVDGHPSKTQVHYKHRNRTTLSSKRIGSIQWERSQMRGTKKFRTRVFTLLVYTSEDV